MLHAVDQINKGTTGMLHAVNHIRKQIDWLLPHLPHLLHEQGLPHLLREPTLVLAGGISPVVAGSS